VSVIGRVGDDAFGRAFLDALDREGIDRRCVTVDPHEGTGVASIVVGPDGENAIIQAPRANRRLTGEHIAAGIDKADAVLATLETPFDVSVQAMRAAGNRRGSGARCEAIINIAPATSIPAEFSSGWGWIVANELEAATFLERTIEGEDDAIAAARDLAARHAGAVVTRGAEGAVAATAAGHVLVPAYCVNVVDTTGAGDAFCAALGVRLAERAELEDAVRFACAAGALACTKAGAEPSMPYRADVEALYERGARRR
jgi:ribokinase